MNRLLMYVVCGIACALFLLPTGVATATELVWTPINPSFGGPSFNAQWLMASAQAQNKFVEKPKPYTRLDPFEDFEYTLKRQYLSHLSRKIIDEAFGEETTTPLEPGEYIIGDYAIDITTNGQITVVITDTTSGNSTTVQIPYY